MNFFSFALICLHSFVWTLIRSDIHSFDIGHKKSGVEEAKCDRCGSSLWSNIQDGVTSRGWNPSRRYAVWRWITTTARHCGRVVWVASNPVPRRARCLCSCPLCRWTWKGSRPGGSGTDWTGDEVWRCCRVDSSEEKGSHQCETIILPC